MSASLELEILKAEILTLALKLDKENSYYFYPSEREYNLAVEEFNRKRREYIECMAKKSNGS